eukprot:11659065-Karenia_brevis.AAC.1
MDDLHHLDCLDGRPSCRLPGWTTFTTCITWRDDLRSLDYLDGRPSLHGLPGRTTFTTRRIKYTFVDLEDVWSNFGCCS